MGFRDDHGAALHRAEALEQELADKKLELTALKAQLQTKAEAERAATAVLPTERWLVSRVMGGVSILAALGSLSVVGVVVTQWTTLLEEARQRLAAAGRDENYNLVVIHNHVDVVLVALLSLALGYVAIGLLRARRRAVTGAIVWGVVALVVHGITLALGVALEGTVDATGASVMGLFPVVLIGVGLLLRRPS